MQALMSDTDVISEDIAQQLKRCKTLPSLPGVAVRIIELSESPTAGLEDVAQLVSQDPALAVRVLRVANSPLYAQRRNIENLRQALALLGLDATLSLALSFSLVGGMQTGPATGFDLDAFWRRSLVASTAAQVMARDVAEASPEATFLGALLQDFGLLALLQVLGKDYAALLADAAHHDDLPAAERAAFGVDHVQAGVWLMGQWNLPDSLREAVAASHATDEAGTLGDNARCIALSGRISEILLTEPDPETIRAAALIAQSALGMNPEDFGDLLTTVGEHLPVVETLFDISVPDEAEREAIIEQAREMLLLRNMQALKDVKQLRAEVGRVQEKARDLEQQVRRDGLTGLFNRMTFDSELASEFERSERYGWPVSVLFLDLDHFKHINDTFGHSVGDDVLVTVSQQFAQSLRRDTVLARYGGEEFVLLLPGSDTEGSKTVGERLITTLSGSPILEVQGRPLTVTVSAGLATHGDGVRYQSPEELLGAADKALYKAKHAGRNRLATPSD